MISLCTNAKIILLDEPTSGMDPTTRREIWSILKKLKSGKIVYLFYFQIVSIKDCAFGKQFEISSYKQFIPVYNF